MSMSYKKLVAKISQAAVVPAQKETSGDSQLRAANTALEKSSKNSAGLNHENNVIRLRVTQLTGKNHSSVSVAQRVLQAISGSADKLYQALADHKLASKAAPVQSNTLRPKP